MKPDEEIHPAFLLCSFLSANAGAGQFLSVNTGAGLCPAKLSSTFFDGASHHQKKK
jgi:hypothetical protein